MSNPWASAHCASALFPSTLAAGEEPSLIPPRPPDPPDPASASPRLSLTHYPPLSPNNPTARALASPSSNTKARSITSPSTANRLSSPTDTEMDCVDPSSVSETRSDLPRSVTTADSNPSTENFTTLPPRSSSPLHTNNASNLPSNPNTGDSNSPFPSFPEKQTEPPSAPILDSPPLAQGSKTQPTPPKPSLVERIRRFEDKTLSRLAPVTLSASGRPSVLIPDAVFQKGADLHKDFIVCCFNGRPPPYSQIQSVLNHMWGKGRKLEIHNNPAQRTVLVRIQSDYLKQKILEKGYWYVGDSMFYTIQWTSVHTSQSPSPKSIQLWAHLTGVPLDLRHQQGLSLVAGLVGEPKETDDFTKNLVSLTLSHVKVELDLTKPAPDVVEFTRESGEVVEVLVSYPWLPPSCSHCKELGHIAKNCLLLPFAQPPPPPDRSAKKAPSNRNLPPKYVPKQPTPKPGPTSISTPSASTVSFSPPVTISPPSSTVPPPVSSKSPSPQSFKHLSLPVLPDFSSLQSPPNPRLRLSLKRSRSDPSLSPPNSSLLQSHVPPNPIQTSEPPPNSSLFLTLPSSSSSSFDPNHFSILASDSSFSKGEFPPTS
ncbi:pollen-specific leucine-rich repeat extensin-like protein 1 isoform X1 [Brassica napus]|uniref:pollen-specific leucine-rich repeat extensin-like protein 1 isoform X1 n=1 Tax=Brassica napus TaxID=3708 RepID=UPI002078C893|nr:pollen-specific leucine-rich repeat extensin-like protein 1 isoform X1 [Brassica napus]